MISIPKHLQSIIGRAAKRAMPELTEQVQVVAERNKEWDYNSPSAMKFFNQFKKQGSFGFASCLDMANAIIKNIDEADNDAIEKIDLCQIGKGDATKSGYFMNITLKNSFLEKQIRSINSHDILNLKDVTESEGGEESKDAPKKQRVLVDFSSPNIAKNMHVGHLRSTIQGDSICRIFEFLGYDVERVNHVGDWGTQFGMLIAELDDTFPDFINQQPEVSDLAEFYQRSKKRFDTEEDFKARAHKNVVKLQSGDEHCTQGWKMLCDLSRLEFQKIYDRLNIELKEVGESFYNPMLRGMIDELLERKIAVENDGAICIFVPKNKVPLIIQKSDGGFNYDTTDMAALRYRVNERKADRVIYVTDIGQEFHFKLVFLGGEVAGYYDPKKTKLDHMPFGMVLQESEAEGADGKVEKKVEKIKTREGKSVKLIELLDEAKNRALKMFEERLQEEGSKMQVDASQLEMTAEKLGISAIKYFDLKQNRIQNYVFSFDKMLDPKGNTGVYLLYMFVRIVSIMQKSEYGKEDILAKLKNEHAGFVISNKSEKELALAILRLPEQLDLAVTDLQINKVCDLIYEIACKIGDFYQESKVVGSTEEQSRVLLLEATKKVMARTFELLGMRTIDKI